MSAAALLIVSVSAVTGADDFISRAAALLRSKDFSGAWTLSSRAADSPQKLFMMGVTALRAGKADEALPLLAAAEQKLPLLGDYAALYQAEALFKLKRYGDAGGKAASLTKSYPSSLLLRRADKLAADALFEAGDTKTACKAYQQFVEKYPSGADAVEALFQTVRCRELSGDPAGALQGYRNIWLNNPASPFAARSQERLQELDREKKLPPCTADELLRRAATLYALNEFSAALKTLDLIPAAGLNETAGQRIALRAGLAQYRLRHYRQAEKSLAKAAASPLEAVRSEARFWLAKTCERQDQDDRALALYTELANEGKRQEYADDALLEAGGLQRSRGRFAQAAALYEQLLRRHPDSRFASRAQWEHGWCRYLAGEFAAAADIFKKVVKDEPQREKALYWLGRALENSAPAESEAVFRTLLDEYPAGFYATWRREQKGIRDSREALGQRSVIQELPRMSGAEKPLALAGLGLAEEARSELSALRKKLGDKKANFPALVRTYLEMEEYAPAIALFMQNRPIKWEKATLPLWAAGYPLAFSDLVRHNAAVNNLSEGLVFALIRAESSFTPAIKSPAGAIGLMQMMPATARQTARDKTGFTPQKLVVPEYNIMLGTRHLSDLMREYNQDIVFVAAAYNAGSSALERWRRNLRGLKKDEFIESIPYQETRDYVKKIYASTATYRQLYGLK